MNARLFRIAIPLLAGLLLAGGYVWWRVQHVPAGSGRPPVVAPGLKLGGPFQLVDHTGQAVTDATYRGKFMLMFFGYTFCPDVCPTELQVVAQAMDLLGADADKVQPIFVSVDPERDTPEHLAGYVRMFHPKIVGLTGTVDQVAAMARAYRVYYAKAKGGDADTYLMDHSAFLYLMGPDGAFVTVFPHGTAAEPITTEIKTLIKK